MLVELRGIQKYFGTVRALDGADLSVRSGEIVALLGDNGAGKSTLIKILSGLYAPDGGDFLYRGERVERCTVASARRMGIETVYQDRALGLEQSLWRNVFMGRHIKGRFGLIDVERERRITADLLVRIGVGKEHLSPDTPAEVLSGGERQALAIGRAMHFDARLVILDEPTTALAVREVDRVLSFIRGIRERGRSAIFITHSIQHAWDVSDRFAILSRGRTFADRRRDELTLDGLMGLLRDASSGGARA